MQSEVGVDNPRSNCMMAALASLIEVPLEELPDLYDEEQKGGREWWEIVRDTAKAHGYGVVFYKIEGEEWPHIAPTGYHIAIGPTVRHETMPHAVVALDGAVVHDPHPLQQGLVSITHWMLVFPLRTPERKDGQ